MSQYESLLDCSYSWKLLFIRIRTILTGVRIVTPGNILVEYIVLKMENLLLKRYIIHGEIEDIQPLFAIYLQIGI